MQPSPNTIPVAYRPPFALGSNPWCDDRPHGETVSDIVRSVPGLPDNFSSRGVVCINGSPVPRKLWNYTKPKPTTEKLPIAVTLHYPLGSPGGGGGGSKSIIGLVAAIALLAVTAAITGPFGIAALGAIGITGFAATATAAVIAGAVGIAGALAISALTAPPTQQDIAQTDSNTDNREAAGAQGNILSPGGSIPRVIGTRKVFPPLITEPLVELIDGDEYVEALMALNGPHLLEDIRIDGASIESAEDVEHEELEGWSTDFPSSIVTRQGKTITPQITLSQHIVGDDDQHLKHPSSPTDDLPVWHSLVTRDSPDEVWVHLLWPGGLAVGGNVRTTVPFRLRARLKGTVPWINFPEFHYANDSVRQTRTAIKFIVTDSPPAVVSPPIPNGFIYAFLNPPPQVAGSGGGGISTPGGDEWVADSYFDNAMSPGDDYLHFGNEGTTRIRNMNIYSDEVIFYLQTATFTPGIYEFEIKRGVSYNPATFVSSTYAYPTNPLDFFYYQGSVSPQVLQSQANISDHVVLTRVASVWNEGPYQPSTKYFSLIAVRARNRQIQRVSVQASGYVRDWDGSGWNDWTTTSNPAPHYVDVLSGEQNLDPQDTDLRDDDTLVAWRTLCEDNDWTCDAIIDDMRTQDVLNLLASCGYARPYQSDIYGVTVDNDRTAESPIQVFSRNNTNNLKYDKAFVRAPEAFIVNYRDEASDDDRAQTIVYQTDTSIATTGLFETISYDGLIDLAKVEARALFDLDQANQRSTFYSFETDIESIVCRRGSLVALQHDVLTSRAGDAHVFSKTVVAGSVTAITLDAELDIVSGNTGVAIRHLDGDITTHALSNATGRTDVLTFSVPFSDDGTIMGYYESNQQYGSLVVVGELNSEYKRMLVTQIAPTADLKATLTLVDEAPDLVRF